MRVPKTRVCNDNYLTARVRAYTTVKMYFSIAKFTPLGIQETYFLKFRSNIPTVIVPALNVTRGCPQLAHALSASSRALLIKVSIMESSSYLELCIIKIYFYTALDKMCKYNWSTLCTNDIRWSSWLYLASKCDISKTCIAVSIHYALWTIWNMRQTRRIVNLWLEFPFSPINNYFLIGLARGVIISMLLSAPFSQHL